MYVLYLHADKAKGLQINLSEALQGKTRQGLFLFHTILAWLTVVWSLSLPYFLLTVLNLKEVPAVNSLVALTYGIKKQTKG